MHVVIFEPCPRGHRFTYVKHVISALAPLPVRISLATSPGAAQCETYPEQLAPLASRFEMVERYPEADPTGKLGFAWNTAASLARAAADLRPDHIIAPSSDGALEMLGARRLALLAPALARTELEAMVMGASWVYLDRGSMSRSARRWAKRRAWAALLGATSLKTLHIIDPLLMRSFRALTPSIAARTVLSPDPVEAIPHVGKAEARRRLGIEESGRLISCVGRLDERKGVDILIRAFLAASLSSDDRLLLVGTHMPEIRSLLEGEAADLVRSGRIISRDGYVSDEQMVLSIAAADLVGVTYRRHLGSASILIRAAAQGRPILSSDLGWPGETCRRFALGTACTVRDQDNVTRSLREALEASVQFTPHPAAKRFVKFHSIENAHACWAERLRRRLDIPTPVPPLTWDWVLETALPLPGGEPPP
ncbi:MAG: glycosyltransferase [Phycisphaeraceae bacterium]|nr:glycosyltransferase [Phycisphaeraceae bacterium]